MTFSVERLEQPRRLLVALVAAVLAVVVGVGVGVDARASSPAGQVAGTRVAAHELLAAPVVAASGDVLAGEGRGTTTRAPDLVSGSRVAPNTAGLADDALVVRGGQNLPENIASGSGVTIDAAGRAHGVSVQAGTEPLETLVRGHIPHGQIGVTTAGEIRRAGGTVIRDPLPGNPWHCLVSCITPEDLSGLLRPTIKNPFL
ncbi:MAG: hypothetical protein ACREEO_03715 [Phenylobacterium sp.]